MVIDAGHGGHDPGCHGVKSKEKEVCLAMALKLGKQIRENYPDIQVIYTRDTDVFVELHERANIANKNKADLFICIHANSGQKTACGSETYVMGLHKTEDNLNVAKRENAVILMEDNYNAVYEGFNPNSDEDIIALTLMQSTYLDQSVDIASKMQNQFEKLGRKNRGVKQAGFLVLYKTAMPSILIETGFLSHHEEEAFLGSDQNQEKMANSMFMAFKQYKEGIDKRTSNNTLTPKTKTLEQPIQAQDSPKAETPQPKIDVIKQGMDTIIPETLAPPVPKNDTFEIVIERDSILDTLNSKKTMPEVVGMMAEKPKGQIQQQIESPVIKPDTLVVQSSKPDKLERVWVDSPMAEIPKESETDDVVVFRVQIVSSPTKIERNPDQFKGLSNIFEYVDQDHRYKYTVGESNHPDELIYLQNSLRQKGFKDAFIIALQNNKRISMKEALQKIKKK